MSADIIQFVPRPNPNREQAIYKTLEQMAVEIFSEAMIPDTAPSEYSAPPEDCA